MYGRLSSYKQITIQPVSGDADDLHQRRALPEAKASPHRLLGAAVKPARKFLIDNHDGRSVRVVVVCEIAPEHQRCLHRVKIHRRNVTAIGDESLIRRRVGLALFHDGAA